MEIKTLSEWRSNEVKYGRYMTELIQKHIEFSEEVPMEFSLGVNAIALLNHKILDGIIVMDKINNIKDINGYFREVHDKLPNSSLFFGFVETHIDRKSALLRKYPMVINRIVYVFDLLYRRVMPRLNLTKTLYFYLSHGKERVLSKAETFGRLYASGFTIVEEIETEEIVYFVARKSNEVILDGSRTYGPIIRLERIGKGGKKFKVFKLRTMHPYSEYLQEYVYNINNLQQGGKIKDDFRISPEGKFLRKYWIDELPMLINVLRGEMKLVGVRPLSTHYYSLYTEELQDLRIEFKPGFVPPFYVDLPKTMEEIMESEKKYLNQCKESELKTDLKYLIIALKNVLIKGVRSS